MAGDDRADENPGGGNAAGGRRAIALDENDVVAAAQILSWIALPHRPQAGVDLLCQWFWARRRHRNEFVPDLPFDLKKPSRVEPQLAAFASRLRKGFRAGQWFELRVLSGAKRPPMFAGVDVSIRSLARRQLHPSRRGGEPEAEGNPIRDIWSKRKPVAHMACAAANEIAIVHHERGVEGFDLEMAVFDGCSWVPSAIVSAEQRLNAGRLTGAFDPSTFYRFHRDIF